MIYFEGQQYLILGYVCDQSLTWWPPHSFAFALKGNIPNSIRGTETSIRN